jgi:DNA-binding response OmpR family regulator
VSKFSKPLQGTSPIFIGFRCAERWSFTPGLSTMSFTWRVKMSATALRLIVVDDNRDAADSLAMLLRLHHHDVWVCYEGRAALQAARACPPDAMLIDIVMPDVDGLGLARLVRQEPALEPTLLIAVTGHTTDRVKRLAREAGFDHFLLKPFDVSKLLALLPALAVRS